MRACWQRGVFRTEWLLAGLARVLAVDRGVDGIRSLDQALQLLGGGAGALHLAERRTYPFINRQTSGLVPEIIRGQTYGKFQSFQYNSEKR